MTNTFNKWQRMHIEHYNQNCKTLPDIEIFRKVFKTDITATIDENIVNRCIEWSYSDSFGQAGRYIGFTKERLPAINEKFQNILGQYEYKFSRAMIADFADYIKTYPMSVTRIDKNGKERTVSCTPYGLSQKFVNMFFKNIMVYSNFLKSIQLCCNDCDCPIDSNILSSIGRSDLAWSKFHEKDYSDCQKLIRKKLSDYPIIATDPFLSTIGNLAYDFIEFIPLVTKS